MSEIAMVTGRLVDPMRLRPDQIDIEEIAWNLSRKPRFNGATEGEPYSVAEHSVHCSYAGDQNDRLLCMALLMHDTWESYSGDILRPIKEDIPNIDQKESLGLTVIGEALGFNSTYRHADVKLIDDAMLRHEMIHITRFPSHVWERFPHMENLPDIKLWEWRIARDKFLDRFNELI